MNERKTEKIWETRSRLLVVHYRNKVVFEDISQQAKKEWKKAAKSEAKQNTKRVAQSRMLIRRDLIRLYRRFTVFESTRSAVRGDCNGKFEMGVGKGSRYEIEPFLVVDLKIQSGSTTRKWIQISLQSPREWKFRRSTLMLMVGMLESLLESNFPPPSIHPQTSTQLSTLPLQSPRTLHVFGFPLCSSHPAFITRPRTFRITIYASQLILRIIVMRKRIKVEVKRR